MLQNARGTFLSTTRPYCKCWGSPGLKTLHVSPYDFGTWNTPFVARPVEAWMTFVWMGVGVGEVSSMESSHSPKVASLKMVHV